jgi:hypothetical protein
MRLLLLLLWFLFIASLSFVLRFYEGGDYRGGPALLQFGVAVWVSWVAFLGWVLFIARID